MAQIETPKRQHVMLLDGGLPAFARLMAHGTLAQQERLIALCRSGTEAELKELLAEVEEEAPPDA